MAVSDKKDFSSEQSSTESTEDQLPSSGVRTFISYALFIHLFLLGATVIGNLPPTSPLRTQLGEIPGLRHYTELLAMNSGYNYHLTYGLSEDTPQFVEITPPEGQDTEPLLFSPAEISPGLRRAHYRNLLLEAYIRAERELSEGLLPQRIADYVLTSNGLAAPDTELYQVQLKRRNLLTPELVQSSNATESDPLAPGLVQSAYNVNVWYADKKLQVIEAPTALEAATIRSDDPAQTPNE